ncbi:MULTISPECIES: nuclear transport factor 2 family protein [unclassified Rhodococcus (in: high G+C Gram-positive bacteria)]|uniref:nuclear transport factor 2 family protein n=1 Tax=unclassified Rhodococcus (in: high G+C Gram-positive bacteria) TaxID=192944 RepID=UPI00339AFBD6
MAIEKLREMFSVFVVSKNADAVPRSYHPEFELFTNGTTRTYAEFERGHRTVYATDNTCEIEYDEQAWVQSPTCITGRMRITTTRPEDKPTRIEVMFIPNFVDGLMHRFWELTWPNWSQLSAVYKFGDA